MGKVFHGTALLNLDWCLIGWILVGSNPELVRKALMVVLSIQSATMLSTQQSGYCIIGKC